MTHHLFRCNVYRTLIVNKDQIYTGMCGVVSKRHFTLEVFLNLENFWLSECLVLYPFVYVHCFSVLLLE